MRLKLLGSTDCTFKILYGTRFTGRVAEVFIQTKKETERINSPTITQCTNSRVGQDSRWRQDDGSSSPSLRRRAA
ncbi:MAG TPA: hypothetical protein PLB05_04580 [Candidatus Omnitrophota bacterium]|nr:hypothetical protein [Candidatus Omnitrophota bacterium]